MKIKKIILGWLAAITAGALILTAVFSFSSTALPMTESVTRRYLASGDEFVTNGLIFTELDDGTYEVGYNYNGTKPSGTVVIPETVNGRRVTRIAEAGFYNCDKLTGITIPDSVTSAGVNAFTGTALLKNQGGTVKYAGKLAVYCDTKATSVTVKDGTLGLADRLFSLVENLKSVTLPTSLTYLGNMTFDGCTKLTTVNIPAGVTAIGSGVFNGCSSLRSVSIPSGVTEIGSYAFANSGVTSASLANVTRIGKGAFENSKLGANSVTVGNGYIDIGGRAFAGTSFYNSLGNEKYLGSVFIGCGASADSVYIREGTTAIADMAFAGCKNLKSVRIPSSVKTIGEDAFFNCPKLATVTIPEGVETIGEDAFRLCEGLTSVSLPMSLKSVGVGAFYGCDNVNNVTYPGSVSDMAKIQLGDGDALPYASFVSLGSEPKTVAPVSSLRVTSTDHDSATLTWSKPSLATGYRVEVYKNGRWTYAGWTDTASYTVTGLPQRSESSIRVYACVGSVLSAAVTVSAQTKLAPPSNVKIAPNDRSITLSWDENTLADSYQVDIFKNGKWTYVTKTNDTSCTVTGLTNKTEYLFKIYSFKGSEYSAAATAVATAADPEELTAVKGLSASASSNSVTLSWNRQSAADSYQVDMMKNGKWTYVAKITDTSYTVEGLSPNTGYQFKVYAFRGSEYSSSVSVSVTTKAETSSNRPSSVTGLVASPSSNSITLSWNKVAGADNYQIDIYKNGSWSFVTKFSGNSYTVTGLSPDTVYQFRVFAFKGSEYSYSTSITSSTKTTSEKPTTVTGLAASPSTDSITLSWNASAAADSYQVDVYRNGKWTYANKVTGTSCTVTGLSPNTSYKFRVFTFKGSEYSASAGITASTKAASNKPLSVTGLTANARGNSITLSWNRSSAADSYQIDMYKNGKWTYVTKISGTSYTISGLSASTVYEFRVFAFKGSEYSPSAGITAATVAAADRPDAVTGLAAMAGTGSVSLYWDKNPTADSYQIDMYKNGKWTYVAKTSGTFYTVTDLYADTAYQFRVFAFKGSKYSASSSITAYTSLGAASWGKPAAVSGLSASRGSNSITLAWNRSTTADSYQIDMYKDGKWTYVAKISGTSYTVTGLDANTSYKFRVFAFRGNQYSASTSISANTSAVVSRAAAPLNERLAPETIKGSYTLLRGIDVSGWQGVIDFNAVKESGVDYVIIKAGEEYTTVQTWETNYENAKKAGLKVGAYWYSYAVTLEEGKQEARSFMAAMKGKQFDFPVYFDIERSEQFDKGTSFVTQLIDTFCGELEGAGYYTGVYCSTNWFKNFVRESTRLSRPAWIADYRGGCYYDAAYGAWQYGAGPIDGVEFDADLNWGYVDYSKYIRANKYNGL